ncbi:MAG: hypothetical protein ACTSUE_13040 [Promethearchaeota archaeon]
MKKKKVLTYKKPERNNDSTLAKKSNILGMVNNFIEFIIGGNTRMLNEEPDEWELQIYFEIDKICNSILNWEEFTGKLAICLGTNYEPGEGYAFILGILTNAAYLKKIPRCSVCKARRKTQANTIVLVCYSCGHPIHKYIL